MATDDLLAQTEKMLAAMDYASMAAEQQTRHRQELRVFLLQLLEVLDGLESLHAHCAESVACGGRTVPLRSVEILTRQFQSVLQGQGVEPIMALGQPLDLHRHDVVEVRTTESVEQDTIVEEKRRGYLWRGSLLRRSMVVVAGS